MDVFSNNKARLILFLLDVCFQHLGLGIQDKYPPLVGFNLHFPNGFMFCMGCLSFSVAASLLLIEKNI